VLSLGLESTCESSVILEECESSVLNPSLHSMDPRGKAFLAACGLSKHPNPRSLYMRQQLNRNPYAVVRRSLLRGLQQSLRAEAEGHRGSQAVCGSASRRCWGALLRAALKAGRSVPGLAPIVGRQPKKPPPCKARGRCKQHPCSPADTFIVHKPSGGSCSESWHSLLRRSRRGGRLPRRWGFSC
jgi:hypothetical protein